MTLISKQIQEVLNEYPFLALAKYHNNEYVGIIQNQDATIISMYVYEHIKDPAHRKLFLEYGAEWWWETNRTIPINIVLWPKFKIFQPSLMTLNMKEFELLAGHSICLRDIITKRIKRKNIQLVRKRHQGH